MSFRTVMPNKPGHKKRFLAKFTIEGVIAGMRHIMPAAPAALISKAAV
jgi:hypothetical protein